jgi:hypothetical protein
VERRGMAWAGVLAVLVVLAFVVPYALLSDIDAWYGSFLFWILFVLVAIAINTLIMWRWKDLQ